jgi:glycine cleavage system H protein
MKNNGLLPPELFYTKNHEWISVDENIVTFGVTEYALNVLGEILYLDLPEDGSRINTGAPFATIESARRIMDLVAPFNGLITEVNLRLLDDPSMANDDPYGDGWLFMAELDNENALSALMRSEEYKSWASKATSTSSIS